MSTERDRSRYRWVVLACGTLAFSTSYLVRSSHAGIAKSLQHDLHLDKASFGLLGSAFFYAYALAQIPWGALADRFGGRITVAGGTLLTAGAIACFAFATDLNSAMATRAATGIFSASVFVPMAAVCARWFPSRERGMANSLYHGIGGGGGQLIALWLMPRLAAREDMNVLGATGWRASVLVVAALVLACGIVAAIFMRSAPERQPPQKPARNRSRYTREVRLALRDVRLWLLAGVFISFTMTIRLVHTWIQVYTADLLHTLRGLGLKDAQVAASVVGIGMTIGQILGEPLYGRVADAALQRGIARGWLMSASLASKMLGFVLLMVQVSNPYYYAAIGFAIGAVGNSAPVVSAAASEIFGERVAGFSMGIVNTLGQLMGASALTLSGWIGMSLSPERGNAIAEYMPIWWLGIGCSLIGIASGVVLAVKHRTSTGMATIVGEDFDPYFASPQ